MQHCRSLCIKFPRIYVHVQVCYKSRHFPAAIPTQFTYMYTKMLSKNCRINSYSITKFWKAFLHFNRRGWYHIYASIHTRI